jgi:hypothetical protein
MLITPGAFRALSLVMPKFMTSEAFYVFLTSAIIIPLGLDCIYLHGYDIISRLSGLLVLLLRPTLIVVLSVAGERYVIQRNCLLHGNVEVLGTRHKYCLLNIWL